MPIQLDQLADDVVIVKRATLVLTDAEIKALPSTGPGTRPIVIPAPGAGKAIRFYRATIQLDVVAAEYTNLGPDAANGLRIFMGIGTETASTTYREANQSAFSEVGDIHIIEMGPYARIQSGAIDSQWTCDISDIENQPLEINAASNAGDLTGGDPANSMKVTVEYSVIAVG